RTHHQTNAYLRLRPLQGFHRRVLEPIASSFQNWRTNFPDEPGCDAILFDGLSSVRSAKCPQVAPVIQTKGAV
ncbi:MAG: hypothetical protein KDK99_22065, partial [Verrucomicrobiales bacterium]|nr:hypothetical protein [Verrucomicrobiales bacterium]